MTTDKIPNRDDYADVSDWARDFEAYCQEARATSPVKIVRLNVLAVQVCAPLDLPLEDVERETSRIHPTGLRHGWRISTRDQHGPNPIRCLEDEARQHWVLVCG